MPMFLLVRRLYFGVAEAETFMLGNRQLIEQLSRCGSLDSLVG